MRLCLPRGYVLPIYSRVVGGIGGGVKGAGSLSSSPGSEAESLEGKLRFRQLVLQRLGSLGIGVTLTPHIQGTETSCCFTDFPHFY